MVAALSTLGLLLKVLGPPKARRLTMSVTVHFLAVTSSGYHDQICAHQQALSSCADPAARAVGGSIALFAVARFADTVKPWTNSVYTLPRHRLLAPVCVQCTETCFAVLPCASAYQFATALSSALVRTPSSGLANLSRGSMLCLAPHTPPTRSSDRQV